MEKLDMPLEDMIKGRGGGGKGKGKSGRSGGSRGERRSGPYGSAKSSGKGGYGGRKGSGKGGWRSKGWSAADAASARTAGFRACKVGAESDVHQTAGYLAATLREGGPVSVLAASAASLNQAMKAIALTRSFIEDEGLDLIVRPVLPEQDDTQDGMSFKLSVSVVLDDWVRYELGKPTAVELFVSGESDPYKVAGAIAKNTRGDFRTFCTAMGPQAVQRATQSVTLAQRYLEGDALDLTFVPAFASTRGGASLLQIQLFGGFARCKVGPQSEVHSTAGFIAVGARSGCPPTVLASAAPSINQAVKSLALARSYLESECLDVIAQPSFPEYDERPPTEHVQIYLFPVADRSVRARVASDVDNGEELYVSSQSDPTKVAGALSKRIRDGADIYMTGMGPQAIWRAMQSVYLAGRYLAEEEIEVSFAPEFGKTDDGGSLMYLHVLAN